MPPDPPQGNSDPNGAGPNGGEPKFVTIEEMNRAIGARFGDFQKKVEKSVADSVGSLLDTKLAELKTSLTPLPPPNDQSKDPKPIDIENHPSFKGLQKQMAAAQAASEQLMAERDSEKKRARDVSLRQALTEKLSSSGLDPKYVKHAVGNLVDTEKRVRFADDDSDEIVFRDGTSDVDLSSGIKTWVKSDEAKIYLPPRGTQGSGDHGHGKPNAGGQQQPMTAGRALLGMAANVVQTGGAPTK